MLALIAASSDGEADHDFGWVANPGNGGGPLMLTESTYRGWGFLVALTGRPVGAGVLANSGGQLSSISAVIIGPLGLGGFCF